MATVSHVNPVAALAANGSKLTGSGKVILSEGNKQLVLPEAIFNLICSEIKWDHAQTRQDPETGRTYMTTGQIAQVVELNGKSYTVSLSVTEKATKVDEFALSPEEQNNAQFATILSMRAVIGDVPTKKALRDLRSRK